jgi:hypothetical protein
MYQQFETATHMAATVSETPLTYEDHAKKIERSSLGYQKAKNILDLLHSMRKDGLDFYGLFKSISSPELRTELQKDNPLVTITQDTTDGLYFYPDKTGQRIEAGACLEKSNEAWYAALQQVNIWACSAAFADRYARHNK